MKDISVTVSSKGQIAIPKAVREKMGLAEGTKLSLFIQDSAIVLRLAGLQDWRNWQARFKGSRMDLHLEREHRREVSRDEQRTRRGH